MGATIHNTQLIRFKKGKTVLTLHPHVTHGKLGSTCGRLDTEIVTVKFSYYTTTHCTYTPCGV